MVTLFCALLVLAAGVFAALLPAVTLGYISLGVLIVGGVLLWRYWNAYLMPGIILATMVVLLGVQWLVFGVVHLFLS